MITVLGLLRRGTGLRWSFFRHLPGHLTHALGRSGGQGKLRLLRPMDQPDAPPSVLKELNNQSDPDRRRRMRREVVALETLPHPSTPRLVDDNTKHFADLEIDLYAVFEFIPGPTLGEYVAKRGPLALADGIALATALLTILEVYHDAGIGHRDIKPDNIILRNGNPVSPMLIDFGMSFNIDEPSSTDTPEWRRWETASWPYPSTRHSAETSAI